jgi:2-oxoglutarate ferredoxin oxidoreductase subunit alpha
MQENLGYATMTETPMVLVDVQRSGPSTGQATLPAQGDVQQARWGTHGDHPAIVLSPATVQEAFDMTVRAFDLAEQYRTPVVLLADGVIGHASESLTVPESVSVTRRQLATPADEMYFGDPSVAPMPQFGEGLRAHVTGSTHEADGMRDVKTRSVHDSLVRAIHEKIDRDRAELIEFETGGDEDADELVVSYGITGRTAAGAVRQLRDRGRSIGHLRLLTLWPFPDEVLESRTADVSRVYVPELNLGQVAREVERTATAPVESLDRIGGEPWTVAELVAAIEGDQ